MKIAELNDWRGATLARLRGLIQQAIPDVVEEWKWRGTPVWSLHGLICTGETYKQVVKMTFANGASVPDPAGLFNASLDGNTRRAIDFHAGDAVDAAALKALVRAAADLNEAATRDRTARASQPSVPKASGAVRSRQTAMPLAEVDAADSSAPAAKASRTRRSDASAAGSLGRGQPTGQKAGKPASLPKSDGDAGVQAYIASLAPWQAALARRVDAMVVAQVPAVVKAVRWHSPFYGVEGEGWFLAFAAFQRHVKFSFFKGASLDPVPPVGQFKAVRSLDVREADQLDEQQLADWIRQAAAIPGWDGSSKRVGGEAL